MAKPLENQVGLMYGYLRVVEDLGRVEYGQRGNKTRFVVAVCTNCHLSTKTYRLGNLRIGKTISCGCVKTGRKVEHGLSRTSVYSVWNSMVRRCTNPKDNSYENYGGRGIRVCDRWLNSVENFYEDMGDPPEGMSIDRIDVNGDYYPENCRWTTDSEQSYNQRRQSNNVSGKTGVGYHIRLKKWSARIGFENKILNLGYYIEYDDAVRAREQAELQYYGYIKD